MKKTKKKLFCFHPKHDKPCPQPCCGCQDECNPKYLRSYPFYHILNDHKDAFRQTFAEAKAVFDKMSAKSGRQLWREDSDKQDTLILNCDGKNVSKQKIVEKYPV